MDFLCSGCSQFEAATTATLNQLLAAKKIKLIWHPVSFLNGHSNPPGYSMRTASAAGCAADVGMNKMKALGEALFQAQPAEGSRGCSIGLPEAVKDMRQETGRDTKARVADRNLDV